jgi:hypothetical protein
MQFPEYPPGFDPGQYPPSQLERIAAFIVLYIALLTLIGLFLPRPVFVKCFKTLFPFMPDSLAELEDKLNRRRKDDQHDH